MAVSRLSLSESSVCKKCPSSPAVVLRGKDVYCRECLLLGVQHKMRATLGKHKATKPGDRILVAVSGGESSVGLLHMLQQGVTADHKKLLFTPLVLWVDEGCVYGHDIKTRRGSTRSVVTILGRYGFSIHEALLEDYNSDNVRVFSDPEDVGYNEVSAERMARIFGSLHDRSSRDELLLTVRRSVMLGAAAVLGCDKILVGDTGTRLAVELMSSVASGVGGSLPHRVGFRDKRGAGGAEILRPMRELSSKEVSLYCVYNRLETWHGQEIQGVGDTIRNVTQEFLVGLQDGFPSTIPTVNKTGEKLTVSSEVETESEEEHGGCALCGSLLDTETGARHNALQATQYSSFISGGGSKAVNGDTSEGCAPCGDKKENGCCGEGDGTCKSSQGRTVSLAEVMECLCYTCRRTFERVRSVESMPTRLLNTVKVRLRRTKMKSEISDFLLL